MISATEKNKQGIGLRSIRRIAILNRMTRECLTGKVTSENIPEDKRGRENLKKIFFSTKISLPTNNIMNIR